MIHTPAVQFHKGGRKRAERGERGMGRTEERREWRESDGKEGEETSNEFRRV